MGDKENARGLLIFLTKPLVFHVAFFVFFSFICLGKFVSYRLTVLLNYTLIREA